VASPDLDLARTQQWMMHVVGHTAEDVADALAAREAKAILPPGEIATVILPSKTLTPAERLEIYHGMYPLRMVEALESDYPALQHFLGDERFGALVRAYVTRHPSRTYTLNRLGDHLPEFVASSPDVPRPFFAAELAQLERAIAQVFDAAESPLLEEAAIAAAGDRIAEARVRPIEAFRLLAFRYPVNAYLQSVKEDDHDHPRTSQKNTWLVVFRRAYNVRRLDLSRDQHTLLAALAAGDTMGEAVEKTLAAAKRRLMPEEFFTWFREWVSAGLFQSLF
jgi:hypothetical protein